MAGIYLHIPFCKQKCHYCNFYSLASVKHKDYFISALLQEIEMQQNYLEGEEIETIYWGGGTPSLLSSFEINSIFDHLYQNFRIHPQAEITLEANPDDLDQTFLDELIKTPVNRLSVGVQSFFDSDLLYLNRIHNAEQAKNALKRARDKGFNQFSVDLIYGIPTLNNKQWEQNLKIINDLKIEHLSAYALTIEPKTALDVLIRKKQSDPVDELQTVGHFNILMKWSVENNWDHYEISNLCKPGNQSKHNTNYWLGEKYLGLGPSAHSFNQESRQWNTSNLKNYIEKINGKQIPFEKEELSTKQKFNEYILLGMRTSWGCNSEIIQNKFGLNYKSWFMKNISPFINNGKVLQNGNQFILSLDGKLFADGISTDLFIEED